MAVPLNTTVLISCEASEEESGPTLVHSTGVEGYSVQPEIIRLLQESCTNQKLCNDEKGVQCTDPPAHILDAFTRAGFTVDSSSTADGRKVWMLIKSSDTVTVGDHQPTHSSSDEEAAK